jgi:hypothetical protein
MPPAALPPGTNWKLQSFSKTGTLHEMLPVTGPVLSSQQQPESLVVTPSLLHRQSHAGNASCGDISRAAPTAARLPVLPGPGPLLVSGSADGSVFVWEDRQGTGAVNEAEGQLLRHSLQKGKLAYGGLL